jgi:hypothetical protein
MAQPEPQEVLQAYVRIQRAADADILRALRDAYKDVNRRLGQMSRAGAGPLEQARALAIKKAILDAQADLFERTGKVVERRRVQAAARAIQVSGRYDEAAFAAVGRERDARALAEGLEATEARAIDVVEARLSGASRQPLSERVYRAQVWSSGVLERRVNSALARGLNAQEFAREVRDLVNPNTPGGPRYAALRLARTEINNAYHAMAVRAAQLKPWINKVEWHLSKSHPKRPGKIEICESLAGRLFVPTEVPLKPHPQCVVAGTVLRGARPEAATARRHTGQFVKIETVNGRDLTVTPNHPILTINGWVSAGELNEGSRIVCCPFVEGESLTRNPYKQQVPALVQDVAATFFKSTHSRAWSVVRTVPEDFHGDGVSSEVAVIGANRPLHFSLDDTLINMPNERQLNRRDVGLLVVSGAGGSDFLVDILGNALYGTVGSLRPGSGLLGRPLGPDEIHSFLPGTKLDSLSPKPVLEGHSLDRERKSLDDLVRGLAGPVEIDELLRISRFESTHDVYNFQTGPGWYIANDIIAHNCLCYITPVIDEDDDEFLDSLVGGEFDDFLDEFSQRHGITQEPQAIDSPDTPEPVPVRQNRRPRVASSTIRRR